MSNKSWVNFRCKGPHSYLLSTMQHEHIVKRVKELGQDTACITEYGSVSGFFDFLKVCKEEKIKPILGLDGHTENGNISFLCKNLEGCKDLFKGVTKSNLSLNTHGKPYLILDEWAKFSENLIVYSGYPNSTLYRAALISEQAALESLANHLFLFKNFYVSICMIMDKEEDKKVAKILRNVAEKLKVECIAVPNSHYVNKEDSSDLRVLLCSLLRTTLPKIYAKLDSDLAIFNDIERLFNSDTCHIPSYDEIIEAHKGYEHEVENTNKVAQLCEVYSLNKNPQLPEFEKGIDSYQKLVEWARDGWKKLLNWPKGSRKYEEYGERIRYELSVIKENGLSNCFLIIADICRFAKENNILTSPGRGSAGGCLISYLLGITQVDPLPYGLLFERFFNPARKNALPDIDLDFPPSKREMVIKYAQDKYGEDCVVKIATFGRLQGKSIIKEVMKIHEVSDFKTLNEICKFIPDESKIIGELEELHQEDEENAKILYWAVVNNAKQLAPWVKLEKDGEYSGEYGKFFAQAIRLEGLYKSVGEHASGVIIAPDKVENFCPIICSKKGKPLAGMPFPDLEGMGLYKGDFLGLSACDKLFMIMTALETGDIYGDDGTLFETHSSLDTEKDIGDD